MNLFLLCLFTLILGYIIYGRIVEKIFGANPNKETIAEKYADGVDFLKLPTPKVFLIQFLNIAGLGPVFGAILGATYGPVCLPWIVLGSIFAGGVHDYLTGMFSVRFKGKSIVFLIEKIFGKYIKYFFLIFFITCLILVGSVFASNPAKLLADITHSPFLLWITIIFIYYFLTTLLPIDKIIGRFYPLFALLLIGVTATLLFEIFTTDIELFPQITLSNLHPQKAPVFPLLFITIACGAISGFHATQSPIMARCLNNEKNGRVVFYGAMITEGIIALIWATLAIAFYHSPENLLSAIKASSQSGVVSEISSSLLGKIGGFLTVLSVVILSITSGDTAFRSARITIADNLHLNQKNIFKRLLLSILVLFLGIALGFVDLTVLWKYFGWANQALAAISLWAVSIYLKKKKSFYFISLIPAIFMTVITSCYILYEKIGFSLPLNTAKITSYIIALILTIIFFQPHKKK